MKKMIWLLVFLSLGVVHATEKEKQKESSRLLVKFHADWCPKCIAWDNAKPGFHQLHAEAEKQAIRVIIFDLTDKKTTKESFQLAEKEGITKFFERYAPGTGFAVLIEADRKKSVTISPIRHDYETQVELLNNKEKS